MAIPAYRVLLRYDPERRSHVASAPELAHCSAEGPSRAEALSRLEEEIEAQVANMRANGARPPAPLDEEEVSGELRARVSRSLHRKLLFEARAEGVELDQLVGELLAAAVEARRSSRRAPNPAASRQVDGQPEPGNERPAGPSGRGARNGHGNHYRPDLLDDRAHFIEYVRNLEHGQASAGSGNGRHRRRRGGGSSGG